MVIYIKLDKIHKDSKSYFRLEKERYLGNWLFQRT